MCEIMEIVKEDGRIEGRAEGEINKAKKIASDMKKTSSPLITRLSAPSLAMPNTTMLSWRSRHRAKAVASMTFRRLLKASSKVMVS